MALDPAAFLVANVSMTLAREWRLEGRAAREIRLGDHLGTAAASEDVFRVKGIRVYQKAMDFMGSGMTGALLLVGHGTIPTTTREMFLVPTWLGEK